MKTLAVLYICTGAYVAFWRDFYPNFKANFPVSYTHLTLPTTERV